jgi:DNA-binding transcriptional ArsR family regulator
MTGAYHVENGDKSRIPITGYRLDRRRDRPTAVAILSFIVGDAVGKLALTPEVMVLIAERFKALAKPARLQILNCLRSGEFTVSELVEETELGQTNVSKHLQLLYAMGFVSRRKEGSSCTMLSPTVACSTSAT